MQLTHAKVSGSTSTAVVGALKEAARVACDDVEKDWTRQIEAKRAELLTSTQELVLVDYGAGRGDRLTEFNSAEPPRLTRTLGNMTTSSKPPRWAFLLFRLIRELRPQTCLEMGSCVGISASYQAAALKINGSGQLVTLEGSEVLAERSALTLKELELADLATVRVGQFSETLTETLTQLPPVDFAFIDGHHVESATLDYMEEILSRADTSAVLVFDDVNWSPGMRRAWEKIVADPRFALTVDLGAMGLAVVDPEAGNKRHLVISYG
jgi:predicted O-methyltransferase YrrM